MIFAGVGTETLAKIMSSTNDLDRPQNFAEAVKKLQGRTTQHVALILGAKNGG